MAHCSKCNRGFLTEWPLVCQLTDCPQKSVKDARKRHSDMMNDKLENALRHMFRDGESVENGSER